MSIKKIELEGYKVGEDVAVIKLVSVDPELIKDGEDCTRFDNAEIRFRDEAKSDNYIDADGWLYLYNTTKTVLTFQADSKEDRNAFLKDMKSCMDVINNEQVEEDSSSSDEILVRVF